MKSILSLLIFVCFIVTSFGFVIPVSDVPVLTDANLITGLLRVDPDDKASEQLSTKCWLWQDEDDLLAYFECEIDSSFYVGSVATRDNAGAADYVRVQLITMPESYFLYYFAAYPTGNILDCVRNSELMIDRNWNSHYTYESKYDNKTWRVTMRIPLAELRFQQKLPYQWKIIITRNHKTAAAVYSYPFLTTDMKKDYFLKAQEIELTKAIKRSLDISLRPYMVKSYDLIEKTSSFDPDHLGMDIAFNPAQRTRIKLSVNPDFSDVPPDNAADNYNSKFPPHLMENRFFFTEDIDVFGLGMEVFYSRRIAQPRLAYKITGSSKYFNWGALGAFDKEIRVGNMLINRDDYYQVLALNPAWRTVKLSNAILSRINDDYYNHVYSGNYYWRFAKDLQLNARTTISTRKTQTDTEAKEGMIGSLSLSVTPGNWYSDGYYTRCSKDINLDMGYLYQKDFHKWGGSAGWDMDQNPGYVKYGGFSTWTEIYEYYPDTIKLHERNFGANIYLNFRPDFSFNTTASVGSEIDYNDVAHDNYAYNALLSYYKWDALSMSVFYQHQNSLVYDLYKAYNQDRYDISIWGSPTPKLNYNLTGSLKQFDCPKVNNVFGSTVIIDNNYIIVNGSISYTKSQKLRFSSAISYDTNDSYGVYSALGYNANLRYEFLPEYFLFAGFQSRQYQDIKSTYNDPLGHFWKASATAYVKLALTL
jgi:hypothetical protein